MLINVITSLQGWKIELKSKLCPPTPDVYILSTTKLKKDIEGALYHLVWRKRGL